MTVPNIPPNKFTSVLWSARMRNDTNDPVVTHTLQPGAVNVSSVAPSPIDPGYVRFTLTQPIPLSTAATGAQLMRAPYDDPTIYGYAPAKGWLVTNAAKTLVVAVDVEGWERPSTDAITWCVDTTPR